jgi:hypothetical protein
MIADSARPARCLTDHAMITDQVRLMVEIRHVSEGK